MYKFYEYVTNYVVRGYYTVYIKYKSFRIFQKNKNLNCCTLWYDATFRALFLHTPHKVYTTRNISSITLDVNRLSCPPNPGYGGSIKI